MIYDSTYFISTFRGPNRLRFLKKKLLARHFQKFGGINRSHEILYTRQPLLDVAVWGPGQAYRARYIEGR